MRIDNEKLNRMEEIKQRFERGYTMAIYGTREALYEQMISDIDALLQALSLHYEN